MRPHSSPSRFLAAVVLVLAPAAAPAQPAPVGLGGLNVTVTSGGRPAAGATVCVGTSADRNQFFQGVTDTQGRVSFASVPPEGFVLTARLGDRGAAESFSIARPGGVPFFSASISLPQAPGGPFLPRDSRRARPPHRGRDRRCRCSG